MITVQFEAEKQTKNTFRYSEVSSDATSDVVVGKLYVRKDALKELAGESGKVPQTLTVTLKVTG